MPISNSILNILNMKDNFIIFSENFLEERIIKDKRCLVFKAYLKNQLEYCPNCGCINNNTIIKYGTKKCLIKIPNVSGLTAYLELEKQIYKCKECNKKIFSKTDEVDYRCRISNNTKHLIIKTSQNTITYKLIASMTNVSDKTIQRVNDTVYDDDKLYKDYLPENICIDEFTYKNKVMAFNFCDSTNGKTIDLVENRSLENLNKYFSYYLKESKEKVKTVVMDMYKPYITLINDNFKEAKIIIDMFHIVQLISRSFNKTRVKVMNKDKINYRKMKRYWRLLLKSRLDLNGSKWKKYLCFKNLMTEIDIVDYILNLNDELKETYEVYQNILYSLQHKDYKLFSDIINKEYHNISSYMTTSINTLKEFSCYIKNTLETTFSNGIMERNNNTCKLIKRIGFGYRNFKNLKTRIMVITNLFRTQKKVMNF